jgi:hypothetical protein
VADAGADAGVADAGADAGVADAGADAGVADAGADAPPDMACVPLSEICNGVDDDCDALIDEDLAPLPCGTDVGECQAGTATCSNGKWGACEGGVGPTDEICDGLDNDCNSVIDDPCCVPQTCDDLGAFGDDGDPCGTLSDGCGSQVSCSCNVPFVCGSGFCASPD